MALKDLTMASARLTESQIETLIRPYVRYDLAAGAVRFGPKAAGLTIRKRILAYLVALQGWPYVGDDKHTTTATPAQIGDALNVDGGSLRPILKQLRDAHLVTASGRAYSAANAGFDDFKKEFDQPRTPVQLRSSKAPSAAKSTRTPPTEGAAGKSEPRMGLRERRPVREGKRQGKRRGGEGGIFRRWIQDGFFDKPRTFREVLEHFHSQGRIIKQTSLPGYLLEAARSEILNRSKKEVDGKKMYVYTVGKGAKVA